MATTLAQTKQIELPRAGGEVHIVAHVGDTLLFNTTDDASASTGFTWRGPQLSGDSVFTTDTIFVKAKDYDQLKKQAAEPPPGGLPKVGGSAPHFGDHFARMRAVKPGRAGIEFIHSRLDFDKVRDPQDTVCDFVIEVQPAVAPTVSTPITPPGPEKSEHVRLTHRVSARLNGFTMGDYLHAEVTTAHGPADFFVMDPPVAYFLALHRRQPMTLIVQDVDVFVPEAGTRQKISRISDVRSGASGALAWWKNLRRHASNESLVKKYDPLVQSLTH